MPLQQPKNNQPKDILEKIRQEVEELLINNDQPSLSLRDKVRQVALLRRNLFDYGAALLPNHLSARSRILAYFQTYIGEVIDSEELGIISGIQEFPRRIRELRTEEGWVIATKLLGRPDIKADQYVLESLEKTDPHTRSIAEEIAKKVYIRDGYQCVCCKWTIEASVPRDRRYFELHHKVPHHKGGKNEEDNLEVRCNVCHKQAHTK